MDVHAVLVGPGVVRAAVRVLLQVGDVPDLGVGAVEDLGNLLEGRAARLDVAEEDEDELEGDPDLVKKGRCESAGSEEETGESSRREWFRRGV